MVRTGFERETNGSQNGGQGQRAPMIRNFRDGLFPASSSKDLILHSWDTNTDIFSPNILQLKHRSQNMKSLGRHGKESEIILIMNDYC